MLEWLGISGQNSLSWNLVLFVTESMVQPSGSAFHLIKPLRYFNLYQQIALHPKTVWRRVIATVLTAVFLCISLPQAPAEAKASQPETNLSSYIEDVIDRVTEFTLDNGMKFIVLERHQAPVVSFMTYVNVGAAYEENGKTGAAHYLEHLAFKGTTQIGTRNYDAEKPLLDRMDVLFSQLQAARAAGDQQAIDQLQQEFDAVRAEAATYVVQNEMGQVVEQEGGVGLNATTSADATRYFYSFPSNKLELWMSLESERFLEPVFREFYEEKDVILEERRMRTDNSPIGRMVEAFLETAFSGGHPYGQPIIGHEADIRNLTREDIQTFFDTYYTPDHMVVAIVGDVNSAEVRQLAETYFGRFEARPKAPDVTATAPTQTEPRTVTLELPSEPWYLQGYQRPSINDPDNVVYQMIDAILTSGRTARLYKALIESQIALSLNSSNGFPGDRYPTLYLIYALTAPGHTVDDIEQVLNTELNRLKTEPVAAEELDRIKTQARAALLRTLSSNRGMASLLPEYEAKTGSWRNLFGELEAISAVTADDIQRVAQDMFQPEKLTIGKLLSASGAASTPTP